MKNPHFHHPYKQSGKIDLSTHSRIKVYIPHSAHDRLKSVFTERDGLTTIAAMFLHHIEREITRNDYTLLDRDILIAHICSRCSESGPRESELCETNKLAGSDGGRTSPDSDILPQPIHLDNDSAGKQSSPKRTKRKERKQVVSGGEGVSVA